MRVSLDRAAKHRVRSARNMILVEVDRGGADRSDGCHARCRRSRRSAAAAEGAAREGRRDSAGDAGGREARAGDAAALGSHRQDRQRLRGHARRQRPAASPSKVDEASDLPHRVLLDFHGVAAGSAPAVTTVNNDDIERVRVATNSREPLITRVVIDLARKIPYTVETVGEELRVLFKQAVDKAVDDRRGDHRAGDRAAGAPSRAEPVTVAG